MRYRLDAQHYINDRLLEPGHIIGDGTDVPFVDRKGNPLAPSASMTPLDGDARSHFEKHFPDATLPEARVTDSIPIHEQDGRVVQPHGGTVDTVDGVPGGYVIGPDGKPTNELKKGLPDPGSPNHPVGQPVIGAQSAPNTTPQVPPPSLNDQGQPAGAPLANPASTPANQPQRAPLPPTPPPMSNMAPPKPTVQQPVPPKK